MNLQILMLHFVHIQQVSPFNFPNVIVGLPLEKRLLIKVHCNCLTFKVTLNEEEGE